MRKSYYLFNPGHLDRRDNTLKFTPRDEQGVEGQPRFLPVETVEDLFVFGALEVNAAVLNFLGSEGIPVHFFNYYEFYTGSFMPRDYLLAGKVQVAQTRGYLEPARRMLLARTVLEGAAANMLRVLGYYNNRDKDVSAQMEAIGQYRDSMPQAQKVSELMGLEGNMRQTYYAAFDVIINDFDMGSRSKRPPQNEVNALISYGNMLCYTLCLKQIYHTQLNPTISFLHEPGARRYSLALDLAEIFKPLLVDRLVFTLLNKRILQEHDFRHDLNRCLLKDSGAKLFAKHWDERLGETIQHRVLQKPVRYKHLVRLECYKLTKHLIEGEEYKPFKIWW